MDGNATEKIIDWSAVMDVCGSESMAEEITKSGLKDARQTVELLAKAIRDADPADAALYAHRLRGEAMIMGAARLSEKAYSIECAGEKKDIDAAVQLFDDVENEFQKVVSFLSGDDWMEKAKQQDKLKGS